MVGLWKFLGAATSSIERAFLFVAVLCVAAIMLVSVADAFMRYALGKPFAWSYAVISHYLLVALFFFAVSETQKSGHHINIDFVTRKIGHRARAVCAAVASLCIMLFAVFVLMPALSDLEETYIRNDLIPGIIRWPTWPTYLLISLGMLLLLCRGAVNTIAAMLAISNRIPQEDVNP